jgi:hypothetical protein
MVAAPKAPVAVGRDIRDDVGCRPRHACGDELGSQRRERAETALFPPPQKRPRRACVGVRRASRGECDPPPGALAATLDRPLRRRAAARAKRSRDRPEQAPADAAEERPRLATGDTARGKEELEGPPDLR